MVLNLIVFLVVLIIGFNSKKLFKPHLNKDDIPILNQLWLYHIFLGISYWAYISYGAGGDALMYWQTPTQITFSEALSAFYKAGPGTYFMHVFNFFPVNVLHLSFFGLSMIYTLIGYIGLLLFYVFFLNNIKYNSKIGSYNLFPLILFLPNLHFWSAGVGKDTLLFFCIALFVFGMQNPMKNLIKLGVALGLSYLIRPHITIFLIGSFGLAFMMEGKLMLYQKIFISGIFLVAFVLLFDNILAYLKIESLDTETVDQFSSTRVSNLSRSSTGSSVDISSYPLPLKMFTFLFRPLFFDINGVLSIVASIENFFLLWLSFRLFKQNPLKLFKNGNYMFKALAIFLSIGTVSFSLILGNLGIMLRQKNMFIPALLFLCMWAFSYQQEEKVKQMQAQKVE